MKDGLTKAEVIELDEPQWRAFKLTLQVLKREQNRYESSFEAFVKAAWHVVEPTRELVWNWHLTLLCRYMEAVHNRTIKRLIVNIPYRTTKSTIVGVMYPAWVWAQDPSHQFLTLAHSDDLATRDAQASRALILSSWYQQYWSSAYSLAGDQNTKHWYQTTAKGHRSALGLSAGVTGKSADTILIDDPHDQERAQSDAYRQSALDAYDQKVANRLNDPVSGAVVLIMQRLHELDLTGHLVSGDEPWEHVILPMEYEGPRYSGLHNDPRTEIGELLDPKRFPPDVVKAHKARLGTYGTAGQFQQRPSPEGGGILKKSWWRQWPTGKAMPEPVHTIQSWDTAFSEKDHEANSYSARTTWGIFVDEQTGRHCMMLLERWRDHVGYPELRKEAQKAWMDWKPDRVLIEKRASGQSLIQDMRRAGIPVSTYQPDRDKVARAYAVSAMLESGQIYHPDRKWADDVIEECAVFPAGAHSDLVDTCVTPDTGIITADGVKPIHAIKVGDRVLTHKGRFRAVTHVMARVADGVQRFKAKGLDEIRITGNHPVWVARPGASAVFEPAETITPRKRYTSIRNGKPVMQPHRTPSWDMAILPKIPHDGRHSLRVSDFCGPVEFQDGMIKDPHGRAVWINDEFPLNHDTGWLFGLFVAEGYVGSPRGVPNKIVIACDSPAIARTTEIIKSVFGVWSGTSFNSASHRATICSKPLASVFRTFGHLAENKIIPEWVMRAPDEFIEGFIEGYGHGDGYVDRNTIRATSASHSLLWHIRLLLIRIGRSAGLSLCKNAGQSVFNGKPANTLASWSLTWRIEQKAQGTARLIPEGIGHWIEDNERLDGKFEVMNLSVADDESYVTVGGTVHNCTQAWLWLRNGWWVQHPEDPADEVTKQRKRKAAYG